MHLAASQQTLLEQLKIHGPRTVKVLARQLNITPMGVRQHLQDLQERGMVDCEVEPPRGRGRPKHRWQLTDQGHAHFPTRGATLALQLLDALRQAAPNPLFEEVVSTSALADLPRYQAALADAGDDLAARLRRLVELRSEDGYMAELRLLPDGNALLIQNHCPILTAAQSCRSLCTGELSLLRQALGAGVSVERVELQLDGGRRCAYRVTRQTTGAR